MVKQNAENTSVKKKLKKEHAPLQEEEEQTLLKKKIKKLKKQPGSSHEEEEETSAKKKSRVVESADGSSSVKKSKRLRENSFENRLALNNEEEKQELKEKKIKRKKRQTENQDDAIVGQAMHVDVELQSENGARNNHRRAKTLDVSFRLLVSSQDIGKVIGKQGSRIQQLREETGAHIKIGDAIMNLEERVIWVSSRTSQSAAERALLSVAAFLIEPEHVDQEFAKIQLLVTHSQAKVVVGKKGRTLDKIKEDTGAEVNVFSKNRFPFLAFASDTDNLLQLVGTTSQVQEALEFVMASLRNSRQHSQGAKGLKVATKGGAFQTTTQIRIPAGLTGKLIGKEGSTIRQIRQQCGVSIEVNNDVEDGAEERIVNLEGLLSQVTMAQTLLQVALASKQRVG